MGSLDKFRRLAPAVTVVHHLPGRIRFKLDPAALVGVSASAFGAISDPFAALDGIPGIASVRVNPMAFSCVVEYDPGRIPHAAWRDALDGVDSAEARVLIDLLEGAYEAALGR